MSSPRKKARRLPCHFDWLVGPPPPELTPFQHFIRDLDWKSSPLGPIENWPIQLRQQVLIVMADPNPAVVYWDTAWNPEKQRQDVVIVYNEPYTHLIGQKHPNLQAQDPSIEFSEIWSQFADLLENGRQTGQTVVGGDQFLLLKRYGFLEETYFTWKFIPVVGPEGYVVASYATVVETTKSVLNDRRMSTVRNFGTLIASAKNIKDFWKQILIGLEPNIQDVPAALLYSVHDLRPRSSPAGSPVRAGEMLAILEGVIGIEKGHPAAPESLDLTKGDNGFAQVLRNSLKTDSTCLLQTEDGTLPEELIDGISWRGFDCPSRRAIVHPFSSSLNRGPLGFLIMFLNPRRPYDTDYRNFVHLLTDQVTSPHVHALLAAADRSRLSDELVVRTREFKESEIKFSRFAERSLVGIVLTDRTGKVTFANNAWLEITGNIWDPEKPPSWADAIIPEDLQYVLAQWRSVIEEQKPATFQCRMKWHQPMSDDLASQYTYTLCSAYPDLDDDGAVKSVMGSVTDITELKWVEEQLRLQTREVEVRMEKALEMKRQQEKFVDMTSHELRNPLSAILHCADEIIMSLQDICVTEGLDDNSILSKALRNSVEAAETIAYCALHQKRIVDDILTLSRLDSNLLDVEPQPTQPVALVENALKIFEAELRKLDITLELNQHRSLQDLGIDWLLLDPNRVLQVFLNLTTNAIKFTRTEATRHIKVTISASLTVPPSTVDDVHYIPPADMHEKKKDADEPAGQAVYLTLIVKDTGKGLNEEEKKNLFHRFSQASPRTYVQYGGSGLGLFISRQLTEMQGGRIGFTSEAGKGSTFMFWVSTLRSSAPQDAALQPGYMDGFRIEEELPELSRQRKVDTTPTASPPIDRADSDISSKSDVMNVLVVEDNLINQKVLAKQLRSHGFKVALANHGEEALAYIKTTNLWVGGKGNSLSVVLMDWEMPVMNGIACTYEIRRLQSTGQIIRHLPVIGVTANARDQQLKNAITSGMDDVCTKPYRIDQIIAQMMKLIHRFENPEEALQT